MIRFQPAPVSAPPPPSSCFRSLTARMADDIRELGFAGRGVSEQTLKERGWTVDTITRLFPQASAIARRQSIRRV